ncbi:unnamed protein product [Somion occarium]|uniref:Post-GPI attachment to proteins factor 3 n=1 Tax=Somion occarium TaxID=3059160 RepID=A0ABP1D5U0_9APHY
MSIGRFTQCWLFVILFAATAAYASSGDRADIYTSCVSLCSKRFCGESSPNQLSLLLRLTRWTCTDECRYGCMHLITDQAIEQGTKIHQYHGKWPFWRFAGMQEPASVAFSLFNLVYHVKGFTEIQARVPDGHPMKRYYLGFALVSINAWIWSSVFHTRDLPTTEKLDYFSAAAAILYAIYYTVVRLFHLYRDDRDRLTNLESQPRIIYKLWTAICVTLFIGHVSYLTLLPRFDYTYNMAFNLIIGMMHNLLWLLYSLPSSVQLIRRFPSRPRSYRPTYANKPGIFVLLMTAATSLELLDFPPVLRIIDAHSLWHLATAPIAALWYEFLIEDSLDDGWRGQRK